MFTLRRQQPRHHDLSPIAKSKFHPSSPSHLQPRAHPVLLQSQVLEPISSTKGTSTRPASEDRKGRKTKEKRVCDNRKDINSPRCFRMILCFEVFLRGVPHFVIFWKSKVQTPLAGHASVRKYVKGTPIMCCRAQVLARDLAVCVLG